MSNLQSSEFNIKQIPYSPEAEQAVLGSIIISPEQYEEVTDILREEDFYVEKHKIIFNAITELYLKSRAIDLITLLNTVNKDSANSTSQNYTNDEDNKVYISKLADIVPRTSNIKDYALIVKEKSLRRQLIAISNEIATFAYEDNSAIETIIDRSQQLLYSIAQNHSTSDFTHIKYVLVSVFDRLYKSSNEQDKPKGVKSGFSKIDNMMTGMNPGDLILVGARPGMGKTAFAMNIAMNIAVKKKTIAVFSLEMTKEQLVLRMLSGEARVDNMKMSTGRFSDDDWRDIADAASMLSECDIYFDDTSNITVTSMKTKLRKLKNLDLVIIDYLQLMQSDRNNNGNRVQEISEISRNLKIMAKELGVPVITCAQLSRGPESRENKRPMLSDLRDSGAIEQDADVVMFLYREEYYKESIESHNKAEVIFAKNRHGSVGRIELGWVSNLTKFYDIDDEHKEQ